MTSVKPGRLYPIPEAAQMLGIQPATLRDWVYRRRIEYVKLGRSVRVGDETIQKLIEAGTVPAKNERALK